MTKHQHAVVIGASISGLLAARVLADVYAQVTLVERDSFPAYGEHRKGVPQARHGHGLLGRGRAIIEELFPGITEELVVQGAIVADNSLHLRWFNAGGFHRPAASARRGVQLSRPLLEAQVRARTLALHNVVALERCAVLGLLAAADRSRVEGVRLQRPGAPEEVLRADLVVDASGRGSRSPAWLEALGYERPPEEQVRVAVTYTSCIFRRTSTQLPGIVVVASPESPRAAAMLPQEGESWIVSVGVYGGQAPTDPQGFLAYLATLPTPAIAQVARQAERLSEPVAYRFPASRRSHYEQLRRFPDGYLVVGDALCALNPVYGQGMTVAALEAAALRDCLDGDAAELARRFFVRAAALLETPWRLAVGSDLRLPQVEGRRTPMTHALNWYLNRLHRAAHHDGALTLAFLEVVNMFAPPLSLLRPQVALRVLWGSLPCCASRPPEVIDEAPDLPTAGTV